MSKIISKKLNTKKDNWENKLSEEQFRVLRQAGTERAFTGKFLKHNEKGQYICGACKNPVFDSSAKFDSGSGWPSFYDAIPNSVILKKDFKLIIPRTEVLCSECGSHLGHVFNDAPQTPTGQRFCINSLALGFKKNDNKKPTKNNS